MPANVGGFIIPTLRYRDPDAALEWLCRAFGFESSYVVRGDDGAVCYAELSFGASLIMLGPIQESAIDSVMVQPDQAGGLETQLCYLIVEDADVHLARAKDAGAEIVLDVAGENGSGRGYCCRDPEGHIWNFGTYDPRRRASPSRRSSTSASQTGRLQTAGRRSALAFGLLANALATFGFLGGLHQATEKAFSLAAAGPPPEGDSKQGRIGPAFPFNVQALEREINDGTNDGILAPAGTGQLGRDAVDGRRQSTWTPGISDLENGAAAENLGLPAQPRAVDERMELLASEGRGNIETAGRIMSEGPQQAEQPTPMVELSPPQALVRDAKATPEPKATPTLPSRLEQGGVASSEQRAIRQARERAPREQRPKKAARRPRSTDEAASTTLFSPWQ